MTYETHIVNPLELDQFVRDTITAGNFIHFSFVSPLGGNVYVTVGTPE